MNKQKGFTLIELAIVLVIIGLLLGGVLRGQELINSAKVKNMAAEFRNIPVYMYAYQDKFRALPGDDAGAVAHLGTGTSIGDGKGTIDGEWDSEDPAKESVKFWQHVRKAGLAPGSHDLPTSIGRTAFYPTNADGGRMGVSSTSPISTLTGAYFMCSGSVIGKYAKQLDITMDDGTANGGIMQGQVVASSGSGTGSTPATAVYNDSDSYTVCMSF
jgi:prepilin-type N-terminal cleavage/methylation domain-containing protein